MIKTVTYFEYQALKVIGKKITVLRANDNTATIVIGKQAESNQRSNTNIHQSANNNQQTINNKQQSITFNQINSSLSKVVPRRQLNQLVGSAGKVARNCLTGWSKFKNRRS